MGNVEVGADSVDPAEVDDLQKQIADRVMKVADPAILHRVEAI